MGTIVPPPPGPSGYSLVPRVGYHIGVWIPVGEVRLCRWALMPDLASSPTLAMKASQAAPRPDPVKLKMMLCWSSALVISVTTAIPTSLPTILAKKRREATEWQKCQAATSSSTLAAGVCAARDFSESSRCKRAGSTDCCYIGESVLDLSMDLMHRCKRTGSTDGRHFGASALDLPNDLSQWYQSIGSAVAATATAHAAAAQDSSTLRFRAPTLTDTLVPARRPEVQQPTRTGRKILAVFVMLPICMTPE